MMYSAEQNRNCSPVVSERAGSVPRMKFHVVPNAFFGRREPNAERDCEALLSKVEDRISEILLFLGITPRIKGFQMTLKGSLLAYKNPILLENLSKMLYPEIAKTLKSTPTSVERCVRHAITLSTESDHIKNLNAVYRIPILRSTDRLSNSDLFSFLVQKMEMEFGSYQKNLGKFRDRTANAARSATRAN